LAAAVFDAADAALPITAGTSARQTATAEAAELPRAVRAMRRNRIGFSGLRQKS